MLSNYLNSGASQCIFCNSDQIDCDGQIDYDGLRGYQSVSCADCGGSWDDMYTLTGVGGINADQTPLEKPEQYDAPAWETYAAVALSTIHLCASGKAYLNARAADTNDSLVMSRSYGWFIKLGGLIDEDGPADLRDNMPESVRDIISLALAHNIGMIEIDGDARVIGELPEYPEYPAISTAVATPFTLGDAEGADTPLVNGRMVAHPTGLEFYFDGHIEHTCAGAPLLIESYNDELRVVAWTDPESEEPTYEFVIPKQIARS